MHDSLYHLLTSVLDMSFWGGEMIGEENLPSQGPAVFIGNHSDAAGPIGAACSIPVRLHFWVVADMMDKNLAPKWLQWDFIERQLHLKPPVSRWLAQALSQVVVPLFYSLGCIPVYRGDFKRMVETLHTTVDLLRKGKFVFIFPEDNRLPADPVTRMQPFQYSFARLGEVYYQETHQRLAYIPVAVHDAGYIMIGKPVFYDPLNLVGMERRRMKDILEQEIIRMYMDLDKKCENEAVRELIPARK
jgi:hypothetical protein